MADHSDHDRLREVITRAWRADAPDDPEAVEAVEAALDGLEDGTLRVAEPDGEGGWTVNEWLKHAVLLSFRQQPMRTMEAGCFEYHDRVPLRTGHAEAGVRVVPPATIRRGAHVAPGAVVMPSYVNIGAHVGAGTMVDTWATVGSCAQVGRNVHLAGGVGVGGVLEPPGARPVVIEDDAFIGSRCVLVEGVLVGAGAVIGAGTVITASTPIIDVRGDEPVTLRGRVPDRAVVIPGSRDKQFPAGTYRVPCALIVGERTRDTDEKVSLNEALRAHEVPV